MWAILIKIHKAHAWDFENNYIDLRFFLAEIYLCQWTRHKWQSSGLWSINSLLPKSRHGKTFQKGKETFQETASIAEYPCAGQGVGGI